MEGNELFDEAWYVADGLMFPIELLDRRDAEFIPLRWLVHLVSIVLYTRLVASRSYGNWAATARQSLQESKQVGATSDSEHIQFPPMHMQKVVSMHLRVQKPKEF